MRHGRAKAARKTLQYFKRTIGLCTPYSVLVDGNFVVMCFQQKVVPIRDRIERVLQIPSTPSPSSTSQSSASTSSSSHQHHHHQHHHRYYNNKKMLQFWITQDTVDELQMILENLNRQIASSSQQQEQEQEQQEQQQQHHHKKNKSVINKPQKVAAFEEALQWIKHECRILPKVVVSSSSNADTNATTTATSSSSLPAWTAMVHYIWGNVKNEQHGVGIDESGGPYIVASQDEELLDILRRGHIGNETLQEMITQQQQQQQQENQKYDATAVPILRLANNNSVLLLEQPSKQFQRASKSEERQKWSNRDRVLSEHERELVDLVKQQQKQQKNTGGGISVGDHAIAAAAAGGSRGSGGTIDMKKRRKAGQKAKGPNPLSCKRKQQGDGGNNNNNNNSKNESASKKRRERAKKRQKT